MKLFATFSTFSLAVVQIANCFPAAFSGPQNETSANGQYTIEGCGGYRPAVEHLIDEARAAIPPAIRDAEKYGTRSLYGFKSMFKTDKAVPLVTTMLRNVAALKALPNLQPFPQYLQKPHFACATAESVHRYPFIPYDPLISCEIGQVSSFYIGNTVYIFLCPTFWALPPHPEEPPPTGCCPEVKNNAFKVYPGYEVYNYQSYVILHELVHFYLQLMSLSGLTIPPEQYSMNGCVGLDYVTSLLNPLNIQTYVAMVQQGCVQSPDPSLPPWAPRALTGRASLPHLNASSPSGFSLPPGFSLSQANLSSSSTFTLPPLNLPPAPGANIGTTSAQGLANSVATS